MRKASEKTHSHVFPVQREESFGEVQGNTQEWRKAGVIRLLAKPFALSEVQEAISLAMKEVSGR